MINYSGKIKVLFQMLDEFKSKGNKVLIFSKTKIFLDLLERLIEMSEYKYKHLRLDGNVAISDRQKLCRQFNMDP